MSIEDLIGKVVTAKRLGWDDDEEDEFFVDHTPYSEQGYASPDLSGVLSVLRFTLPDGEPGASWSVGGQSADEKTVAAAVGG